MNWEGLGGAWVCTQGSAGDWEGPGGSPGCVREGFGVTGLYWEGLGEAGGGPGCAHEGLEGDWFLVDYTGRGWGRAGCAHVGLGFTGLDWEGLGSVLCMCCMVWGILVCTGEG